MLDALSSNLLFESPLEGHWVRFPVATQRYKNQTLEPNKHLKWFSGEDHDPTINFQAFQFGGNRLHWETNFTVHREYILLSQVRGELALLSQTDARRISTSYTIRLQLTKTNKINLAIIAHCALRSYTRSRNFNHQRMKSSNELRENKYLSVEITKITNNIVMLRTLVTVSQKHFFKKRG